MTDIQKTMFSGIADDFSSCFDLPCEEPAPCSPLVYPPDEELTRMSYCPAEVPSHEYRVFGDPAYLEQSSSEDSLQSLSVDEETRLQLFLSQSHQEQPHSSEDVPCKIEVVDLKPKVEPHVSDNECDECEHPVKEEHPEEEEEEGNDVDDVNDVEEDEKQDDSMEEDNNDSVLYIEEGFEKKDYDLMWENINAKKAVEMQRQHYQMLQQQRQQQIAEKLRLHALEVVEVTPLVSAEKDCYEDVPAMELCPEDDGEAGMPCGSMRRPRDAISSNNGCCPQLFEGLGVRRKNYYAVQVTQRNISTEMFTGKIDPMRRVLNIPETPARATLSSLLRPAVVQSCSHLWEIAMGYVVPATSTMNRILLGRVMESEDELGMQIDMTVSGWLVPDQVSDLKWMSTTDLVVSYGKTVAVVNTATRASLASKRPSGAFTPYMSLTFDDENKNRSICETEVIPGECSLLVASQSSCFSRVSMGGKSPVVDGCHCFHKDGLTSARTVLGSRELASCTMESGHVHCFDARERWEPVLSMTPHGLQNDTLFLSHDWVDENTCVCAYHNSKGSYLKYMDRRFASDLDRVDIPVFPYDIRARNGDCLISGDPSFVLVTKEGNTTTLFKPKPAPEENVFQPNVMCAQLDDARFLTASNHLTLAIWSRLV